MRNQGPGFAVLYRWRLHPGLEESFIEAWSRVSEGLQKRGSLGSRLHRGHDGL
jgi:heme-degrading monooxygenase HmoA